jgi:hydroxymethylpyrimidine pyrophosphatase-like HAD family hydrolase
LYDYQAKKVLESDPLPVPQALQLIDLLDEHAIHGLMYVDNAMLYERPTGHVVRTSNWALSLPEAQRPVFTQVPPCVRPPRTLRLWKFALTDEDTTKLNTFAKHVEQTLGLECEWSHDDQVDIARKGNSKGKRLTQYVESQGWSMRT